jgi:hypothetical protein
MNIALWVVQGLLALLFLFARISKLAQPKSKVGRNWVNHVSDRNFKIIGIPVQLVLTKKINSQNSRCKGDCGGSSVGFRGA